MNFDKWFLRPNLESLQEEKKTPTDFAEQELGLVDDDYSDDEEEEEEAGEEMLYQEEFSSYVNTVINRTPASAPWKRPVISSLGDKLICQHIETTYAVCSSYSKYLGEKVKYPEIRLFATTESGNSVLIRCTTFKPYFYAEIPNPELARHLVEQLEYMMQKNTIIQKNKVPQYILGFESVLKRSMSGYHRNLPLKSMYKITTALPCHVATLRNCLEGNDKAVVNYPIKTYEANVLFELRFMVDYKIYGCQWLEIDLTKATEVVDSDEKISTSQFEFILNDDPDALIPIPIQTKGDIAPIRILSLDIECKRKKPGFVKAQEDPVIVICSVLSVAGASVHRACFVFVENTEHYVNKLPDASTYLFRNEESMLLAFSRYISESDPDAFTGWNTGQFDWPYLCKRANVLKIGTDFLNFSRILNKQAWMRSQLLSSKAYGTKMVHELVCEGRFLYDGLDFMLRGQMTKFRLYTLNAISKDVLGDQKADVTYTQIPILHEGTDEHRTSLVYYCLKDAMLPLRILDKLMAVINGVEQSRVTGVPLKWLLTRGQGIKTFSNVLRKKNPEELVPSKSPKINTDFTKGGYVRDPIQEYVTHPLATFDFASLYPSIMQAYNICYSTVESVSWARDNLKEGDYYVPPMIDGKTPDFCFVKSHIREGVLPNLLTSLLKQRAYVKTLMKTASKEVYNVLDGRQLALKVVCNSVYGYLKAFIQIDPRLMSAVTAWGQEMIIKTADIITTHYKDNIIVDRKACDLAGIDYEDATQNRITTTFTPIIRYGDTDSVVVDFGDIGIQDLVKLSKEAAALCTKQMVEPNSLSFESIKLSSCWYKKKKYASLEILAGDIKPDFNTAMAREKAKLSFKGIESKRRDNAKIASETQKHILKLILKENNVKAAEEYVKKIISDILNDNVDMSKFIISKGLSKTDDEYKKKNSKLQHVELKKRISKRCKETGEIEPETGDRVPFVFIAGPKGAKSHELSEDPIFVQKNGIPIDKKYYINKQVFGATVRIFTCIYEPKKLNLIKSTMSTKQKREFQVYNKLFDEWNSHRKQIKNTTVKSYGIGQFATKFDQCLEPACQNKLTDSDSIVCESHKLIDAYEHVKEKQSALLKQNEDAWEMCRKCAGDLFDTKTCSNTTCENFFHRQKTLTDIEDIDKLITKSMKNMTISPNSNTPKYIKTNFTTFKPVNINWKNATAEELLKKPTWKKKKQGVSRKRKLK